MPGELLADTILSLLDDPERLQAMGRAVRRYYRADALETISKVLASLVSGGDNPPALPEPTGPVAAPGPDFEAMTAPELIRFLTRRRKENGLQLSDSDLEYLKYRTDDYLASPQWQIRNHGVKLVGLLEYRERLPHLLYMLEERRPVRWPYRLLGGDFVQVGFIRRNIFDALIRLDADCEETFKAIELGLEDPYFEVRSHAARAAEHFADRLGGRAPRIQRRLEALLNDKRFEVVCAVVEALGGTSADGRVVERFRRFRYSKYWRIRLSVARALVRLLERGVAHAEDVEALLEEVLITSDGFQPHFPLKAELRHLAETLARKRAQEGRARHPKERA